MSVILEDGGVAVRVQFKSLKGQRNDVRVLAGRVELIAYTEEEAAQLAAFLRQTLGLPKDFQPNPDIIVSDGAWVGKVEFK